MFKGMKPTLVFSGTKRKLPEWPYEWLCEECASVSKLAMTYCSSICDPGYHPAQSSDPADPESGIRVTSS